MEDSLKYTRPFIRLAFIVFESDSRNKTILTRFSARRPHLSEISDAADERNINCWKPHSGRYNPSANGCFDIGQVIYCKAFGSTKRSVLLPQPSAEHSIFPPKLLNLMKLFSHSIRSWTTWTRYYYPPNIDAATSLPISPSSLSLLISSRWLSSSWLLSELSLQLWLSPD